MKITLKDGGYFINNSIIGYALSIFGWWSIMGGFRTELARGC